MKFGCVILKQELTFSVDHFCAKQLTLTDFKFYRYHFRYCI